MQIILFESFPPRVLTFERYPAPSPPPPRAVVKLKISRKVKVVSVTLEASIYSENTTDNLG